MNSATRQLFFFFLLHYTRNMLFSVLPDVQRFQRFPQNQLQYILYNMFNNIQTHKK